MTPPPIYHDPRFLEVISRHDKTWKKPTRTVKTVLGQNHPAGHCTTIDDPDVQGIAIHPKHDYQGLSSAIVLARTMSMDKMLDITKGNGEVYLFDDMTMKVKRWFVVEHAFLLVGVVEQDSPYNKPPTEAEGMCVESVTEQGSPFKDHPALRSATESRYTATDIKTIRGTANRGLLTA